MKKKITVFVLSNIAFVLAYLFVTQGSLISMEARFVTIVFWCLWNITTGLLLISNDII